MTSERGVEKSGYLEVKQPSTTKGRKLKTWKKRWVIVHQMSDLANGKYYAKIDIYPDEFTSRKPSTDKMTFVLENITSVQLSKSKTHPNAFEVVESEPVLVFSAATEQETDTWMSIYKRIFQHDTFGDYDIFGASLISNSHSQRLKLEERVLLSMNTSSILILTPHYNKMVEWKLSSIKRFYTEENAKDPTRRLLILECGPNATGGEGKFCFWTPEWELILRTIRKNINLAIAERQQLKVQEQRRDRTSSTCTTTSEFNFTNLLANSESVRPRSMRSDSDTSIGSSVFSAGSCNQTPPLSPVTSSSKLDSLPITSTPNPTRTIRSESFKVPMLVIGSTLSVVEDGYSEIKGNDSSEMKPRSGSVSSTTSASSNKSHISNIKDSGLHDMTVGLSDKKPLRTVSNSFDSGFSNGSYEEATKRKGSDVEVTGIKEEPQISSDPSNIYQELDYTRVLKSRLENILVDDNRGRRHSTGDVTTDPDYAELDSRKLEDGIFGSVQIGLSTNQNIPPALPDRPPALKWSNSIKHKPSWKKRLSALLISGPNSPNHSPDRCESPINNQKIVSSDIVLDNMDLHGGTDSSNENSPVEQSPPSVAEGEHLYQSIPEVLLMSEKKFATLPAKFSAKKATEQYHLSSDIILPSESINIGQLINSLNTKTEELSHMDTINPPAKHNAIRPTQSNPLIDFFFKDDGFEILQAQTAPITPTICPTEAEKPLIDFGSFETLPVDAPKPAVQEGHYMDMTNRVANIPRVESVEYLPPSAMGASASVGNLIDI